jgi:hypothetical protein
VAEFFHRFYKLGQREISSSVDTQNSDPVPNSKRLQAVGPGNTQWCSQAWVAGRALSWSHLATFAPLYRGLPVFLSTWPLLSPYVEGPNVEGPTL